MQKQFSVMLPLLCLLLGAVGCDSQKPSEGLALETTENGCISSGIGTCMDKCIVIPSEINGSPVTAIRDGAFSGCTGLTNRTVAEDHPVYHSTGNCLIETEAGTLVTSSHAA